MKIFIFIKCFDPSRDINNRSSVSRQYTPVSDVNCVGHFDLLIKVKEAKKNCGFLQHK